LRWADPHETRGLDEDFAPFDCVAVGVELVAVEPAPAVVCGAFIDVDHPHGDRGLRGELHAGPRVDVDHVSRPQWRRGRAPRRGRQLNLPVSAGHVRHRATSGSRRDGPWAGLCSEEEGAPPPALDGLRMESLLTLPVEWSAQLGRSPGSRVTPAEYPSIGSGQRCEFDRVRAVLSRQTPSKARQTSPPAVCSLNTSSQASRSTGARGAAASRDLSWLGRRSHTSQRKVRAMPMQLRPQSGSLRSITAPVCMRSRVGR
jgi:hypothetical protein